MRRLWTQRPDQDVRLLGGCVYHQGGYDPAAFYHSNSAKARELIEKLERPPGDV